MANARTQNSSAARGAGLPRSVLIGAAALVAFSLAASGFSRVSDIGTTHMPPAAAVEVLNLRFEDRDDGGVNVRDAKDNAMVQVVSPGTNGFLRSTLRGLVRERKRSDIGEEAPFRLTRWSDGTLSLEDDTTGRRVSLEAFGPANSQVFANLLSARSIAP